LSNGTAITTHAWQGALAGAGQPRLRWHDLGAAHGALLLQSGIDFMAISKQLGHSHMNVTAKYDAGVADELGREAADRPEGQIYSTAKSHRGLTPTRLREA
jgi:integrase